MNKQGVREVGGVVWAVLRRVGGDSDLADQARWAGLLGAMMQDLSAVKFVPSDKQYEALLDRVMAIFDRNRPAEMEIKVVIEAAEALEIDVVGKTQLLYRRTSLARSSQSYHARIRSNEEIHSWGSFHWKVIGESIGDVSGLELLPPWNFE